ncbi:hypothetical protein BC936DRAFT_143073, partial [Jimgerdemannia flammicorona]
MAKRQTTDILNQPPAKRSHTSFDLLEVDLTEINHDHVNEIILLDQSRVPEGEPTGIDLELLNEKNYPDFGVSGFEDSDSKLPFLIRDCALQIIKSFRIMKRAFDRRGHFGKGNILQGPAGAGKSYVLYHVVQFCRASGWLVLYIPTAGAFNEYDNERAAGTILDNFLHAEKDKLKDIEFKKGGPSLYDFISDGLDNEKYFETWKGLSNLFSIKRLKYPFLIAVDEWNVKFDNPRCQELFEFFGVQKLVGIIFFLH